MLQWANLFRLSTLLLCVNLFGFPVKDYAQTDLNRNEGHGNTDLQLTKTVDRLSARVGTRIMFTVQLKNIGIKRAEDVIVTDLLSSGFSFAGSSNPQRYNSSTGRWTIKDLRAGDSISLQILAVVNPITPASNFTNLAYISQSDGIDPDKKNDTARVAVAVYDFSVNSSTICANTSARLQAGAVNVVNPVFKWYADQGLTQLIFTGAVFETPALLTDQSYYVVVNGDNIPPPSIADALVASVTVQPSPIAPAVALVQPDCTNPTGIINVTTPLVAGNKFSIDGITFNNTTGVFPRVLPGNYAVYIQSANGCISPSTTVMIAAAPVTPVAPSLTVVQPTCSTGTGSITVSSPRNPGYRYSIDGVDYSDSTGIFRQLAPGTYNVSVKSNGGCVSGVVTAVIEQNPLIPVAPVLTVVQPVCPSPTGSITVTLPVGSGYTYSIDGNTYSNQTGIFTSLLPGSYQVSVKNANGCVGASTLAVIEPPVLNDPVLTISASGSTELCAGGTVVLTASGTGIFQWFKYGIPIAGAQSANFTASSEGVFTVSRRSADGCYSRQSEGILVTRAAPVVPPLLYAEKLSFCEGDSIQLQAIASGPIKWSKDGVDIADFSGSSCYAKAGGVYTVTLTGKVGCEQVSSNPVFIQMYSRPEFPVFNVTQPDCNSKGIITVTAPVSAGYQYSIVGTGNFNTTGLFSDLGAGNYTIYIKSSNGCVSPSATAVIVSAPVTPVAPSLTVVQPTCSTGTGSITVSSPRNPGYRYSIDGVDYSDSTGIFRQLAPGTYNVSVKSNGGCVSGVVTAVIEQNPLIPVAPVLTVVQPVCPSPTGSITVTLPVGSGYTYSIDGNTYSNQTGIFTSLLPGSYQVSVKNANGCVGASTLAVIEPPVLNDPVLTISASGSTELCAGGTVVLTASGTGIFQWFKYGIPIAGAQSANFTASSEGVFTVSRRSADGCYSRQSEGVLVTVAAPITLPVLYADKLSICSGDSVVLIAGITGSVQWSKDGIPIDTTSTNILTVKEGGIYTIRSLSSGGCEGSVSNPVPVRVLSRPDKPLLEVLQPTCTASGQIKITSPLGSGYLYTIDRTAYNNASGLFTGVLPGTYGVGVKSLNGCVSTVTEAIIKSVAIIDTLLSITASKSTDLCVGETVTLTAGNAESYQWFQNGFAIAGANDKTYEVKGEGIYAVARRNIGTCVFPLSAGVPVRIVLPPAAPVIATAKQLICAGETVQLQSSQAFALQWFRNGQPLPGATGVQLTVQSSGTYTAISLNSAGCSSAFSNPLVITVVAKPAAPVLEIDGTTQFCKDESRLLRILTIPPAHSIQWYRNNTLIPLVFTDTLRVSDGATYRVTFTNNNGCISDFSNAIVTAVVCVTGIYVPDVFTPNGDGVNDVIRPITPGIKKFKWFRIYNRWGNLVFESADAQKAWDGKFRGQDQPAETYIWVVEGADSRGMQIKKSGMLNLVR